MTDAENFEKNLKAAEPDEAARQDQFLQRISHVFKGTDCDITYTIWPKTQDIVFVDILDKKTEITYKIHPNLENRDGAVAEKNTVYPLAQIPKMGPSVIFSKHLKGEEKKSVEIEMPGSAKKKRGDLEIAHNLVQSFMEKDALNQSKLLPQAAVKLFGALSCVAGEHRTEDIYKGAAVGGKPVYILTVKNGMDFDAREMELEDNDVEMWAANFWVFDFSYADENKVAFLYKNHPAEEIPYDIFIQPINDTGEDTDYTYLIEPINGEFDEADTYHYPYLRLTKHNDGERISLTFEDIAEALELSDKARMHVKPGEMPESALILIEDLRAAFSDDGRSILEEKFEGVTEDNKAVFLKSANQGIPATARIPSVQNEEYVESPNADKFRSVMRAAQAGDGLAMYFLGLFFKEGKGTEQDDEKAFLWFSKGAKAGIPGAMEELGDCYDNGRGTKGNKVKAFKSYLKAAKAGNAGAMLEVGIAYHLAKGIEQDYAKALEWYLKAAEKGRTGAMHNIGYLYRDGRGVEQNDAEAFVWFLKAAEGGNLGGILEVGKCHAEGRGTKQDGEKAVACFRQATQEGRVEAMYRLGQCYEDGRGVERDYAAAVQLYRQAADQDYADAQYRLAQCYETGRGVGKNPEEAFKWYEAASNKDHWDAFCMQAMCYEFGIGVKQNELIALTSYLPLADVGNELALGRLKELACLEEQDGVVKPGKTSSVLEDMATCYMFVQHAKQAVGHTLKLANTKSALLRSFYYELATAHGVPVNLGEYDPPGRVIDDKDADDRLDYFEYVKLFNSARSLKKDVKSLKETPLPATGDELLARGRAIRSVEAELILYGSDSKLRGTSDDPVIARLKKEVEELWNAVEKKLSEPHAEVKNTWVDHNVYEGGQKGMRVHLQLEVANCLQQKITVGLYFYFSNGEALKDFNQSYRTTSGNVYAGESDTPTFDCCKYNDFPIFMPYSELHLKGGKKHSLKCDCVIWKNHEEIGRLDDAFTFTYG